MARRRIGDVARLVRSKNAGPFWLTIDVMFDDDGVFAAVCAQRVFAVEAVATLFKLDPKDVLVFEVPAARAVKVSFPRSVPSGSPGDADVFGGQQYAAVLDIAVELP